MKKAKEPRSRGALRGMKFSGVSVSAEGYLVASDCTDPLAGLTPAAERALIYSRNSHNKKHRARRRWHWLPNETEPEIFVHHDGWTTAHPGSLAADVHEEPLEALMRNAGLTAEEQAVWRAQAAGAKHYDVAAQLELTLRQVERRVSTANKKLTTYGETLRGMEGA